MSCVLLTDASIPRLMWIIGHNQEGCISVLYISGVTTYAYWLICRGLLPSGLRCSPALHRSWACKKTHDNLQDGPANQCTYNVSIRATCRFLQLEKPSMYHTPHCPWLQFHDVIVGLFIFRLYRSLAITWVCVFVSPRSAVCCSAATAEGAAAAARTAAEGATPERTTAEGATSGGATATRTTAKGTTGTAAEGASPERTTAEGATS